MIYSLMLDTNMISHIVKQQGNALRNFLAVDANKMCISVISYGEVVFGLEKRPEATKLNSLIRAILMRVDVLPWTDDIGRVYGSLRSKLEKRGIAIGDLDLLIATHAIFLNCTLVTADKAFGNIPDLKVDNWL